MTIQRNAISALSVADIPPETARTQVAALCWRADKDRTEVLLVTSRETGRWVLPKGWPMTDRSHAEAARREAWEEAGVEGRVGDRCIGRYAYLKWLGREAAVPCVVSVFPLRVKALAEDFPERGQRQRRWFSPKKAAARVDEPELRALLAGFDPGSLAR